jgi:tetratricopeptide (TPR) repeat protein
LLVLLGLLFILMFGGLGTLRREGLPLRLAVEGVTITLAVAGLVALTGFPLSPVLFLFVLYVLTMRVRLLVDVGNMLARRGNHERAASAYRLALRLWPDETGRLVVQLNQGVLDIHRGRLDEAIAAFRQILSQAGSGYLGLKQECGCHYNLGVAYQKKGLDAEAALEFNAVLETWPASEYARYASIALERRRKGK